MDHLLEARQARLGNNQSLFRAINEEVEKITEEKPADPAGFICECANPDCGAEIVLTLFDYEAIRQNPARFFVLSQHVFRDVEDVVEDRGEYVIVEKFGAGGRVAVAADNRAASD
jgi:hypothetical protein